MANSEFVCKILCVEDPEFWSKCPRHFWSTLEYSNSLIKNVTVQLYMQHPVIIWCFIMLTYWIFPNHCSFIPPCLWTWWSFTCNVLSSFLAMPGELLFNLQDLTPGPCSLKRFHSLCQEQNVAFSLFYLLYNTHHISPLNLRGRNVSVHLYIAILEDSAGLKQMLIK